MKSAIVQNTMVTRFNEQGNDNSFQKGKTKVQKFLRSRDLNDIAIMHNQKRGVKKAPRCTL
jgi:hypothetical protein